MAGSMLVPRTRTCASPNRCNTSAISAGAVIATASDWLRVRDTSGIFLVRLARTARRIDLAASQRHRLEDLFAYERRLFVDLLSGAIDRREAVVFAVSGWFRAHSHAPCNAPEITDATGAAPARIVDFSQSADDGPRMLPSM
jgi:hypothetical protein